MTALFTLGHQVFLFGARWANPTIPRALKPEAREAARTRRDSLFILRQRPAQFATASLPAVAQGRRRPTPSLLSSLLFPWHSAAATLARTRPPPTLGVWPLPDGRWWLLAVGAEGIMPTGDILLAGEAEAAALFETWTRSTIWRERFAPSSWSLPDTRPDPLKTLLAVPPQGAVRPLQTLPRASLSAVVFGSAALTTVALAILKYTTPSLPVALPLVTAPPHEPPHAPATIATLSAVFEACHRAERAQAAATSRAAWKLRSLTCSPGQLAYDFERLPKAPLKEARATLPPGAQATPDLKSAHLGLATDPAPMQAIGPLPTTSEVTAQLAQLRETLALGADILPRRPPDTPEHPLPPQLLWTFTTTAPGTLWAAATKIPATVLLRTVTVADATTIEGLTYVAQ